MESVLESTNGKTNDGEDAALWVLNREWADDIEGSREVASRYARALPEKLISDISEVEDVKLWPSLMQGLAVNPTTENVALYFNGYAGGVLSSDLVEFINEFGISDLSEDAYREHFVDQGFALEAFRNEDLDASSMESILRASKASISSLAAYGVSLERTSMAIDCGSVEMSPANLDSVISLYPSCIVDFIRSHPAKYAEIAKGRPTYVNEDAILEVLGSKCSDEEDQIKLAGLLSAVPPSEAYGDALNIYVIEERFKSSFVDVLGALRKAASNKLSDAIDARYIQLAASGIDLGKRLPIESCWSVMRAEGANLSNSRKALILARYVPGYNREEVASCLQLLGFENLRKAVAREVRSEVLTAAELNGELLDALREKGFCGKLNEETNRLFARWRAE